MNIQQVGKSIKKGLIKYLKTAKLKALIGSTIIMFFVVSGDLIGIISEQVQTKKIKDGLLMYKDFTSIVKIVLPNVYVRWIIFSLIIVIWGVVLYIRIWYEEPVEKTKEIINILAQSSLGKTQFKLSEESLKVLELRLEELELIQDVNIINENYTMLQSVVNKQDNFIEMFKGKINNNDKYGYMGITHTPLILRAGYKIGDETRFTMLHKKRNMNYYEILSNSEEFAPIQIEKKRIKDESRELIVAISTTFPIHDGQLSILQPDNKSIIKFKTDELGFDVVTSEKQVDNYVHNILSEVRQIVGEKGINRIHMVISSSVAVTFALGQGLSSHYDPEIIIYHYDSDKDKKYPWGISLFKNPSNCIVVN